MRMRIRTTAALATMALAATVLMTASANAAVIYEETFNGDTSNLNGKAPATRPGSEVWTASSLYDRDGTVSSGRAAAYLPFTPVTGDVYRLTATYSVTQMAISIGFADAISTTRDWRTNNSYGTGVLSYDDVNENYTIRTDASKSQTGTSNIASGVTLAQSDVTFEITLDTTDADAANWTVAWSVTDGTTTWTRAATTAVSGSYGDISEVMFTNGTGTGATTGGAGTLEYLKLETVVPEPASLALVTLGGMLVLGRPRR